MMNVQFGTKRLFSPSFAEVQSLSVCTLSLRLRCVCKIFYHITTSLEARYGPVCNLHKCEMETEASNEIKHIFRVFQ